MAAAERCTCHFYLAWAALPIQVLPSLFETDAVFNGATVLTYLGTPPQGVRLTLDLAAEWLAAYAYDCVLCSGGTSFNPLLSTSFQASPILFIYSEFSVSRFKKQSLNLTWPNSIPGFSGAEATDLFSFGGILNAPDRQFGANVLWVHA